MIPQTLGLAAYAIVVITLGALCSVILWAATRLGSPAPRTIELTTDTDLQPEDMQAMRVLLDRYECGDALFAAIVAQVAEDAAEAEADAFIASTLDGAA